MKFIKINPADNVAVALEPLVKGEQVLGVTLQEDIPAGHKITLRDFAAGENVIKYGYPIGHLLRPAPAGTLIDHNCIKTNLEGLLEYKYEPVDDGHAVAQAVSTSDAFRASRSSHRCASLAVPPLTCPRVDRPLGVDTAWATFSGFRRADGQVGVRNQIWIIPTVGCVNGICGTLAERFKEEIRGREGSVDAVVAFPHNYGCSQLGDDHANTRTILADMVHHPNAGGVLIVSLGCENNQLDAFMELVGEVDGRRVKTMTVQKIEGDETEHGLGLLREIFAACQGDVRSDVPVSELKVGLKCGGSDGLSGITANPLLGVFSDWIVAEGGTTVLTEVPEMFGAETILMNRCADRALFEQTVSLINDFKTYFIKNEQPVYENPSPGNKAGGISTLEEKSLGCTQKSGQSLVRGVLEYGQRLSCKGLNLLSAPGNDLVASTALAAAGCQIVLFTTGRGTPFGSFVPTMKISTNSRLASMKPTWIDFNAGVLAEGEPMPAVLERFRDYVLAVASGTPVNNEKNSWREIAIFKSGVTL